MGAQSVPQLFSTFYRIHLVLHVPRVLVLKSWRAELCGDLHPPTASSDFSLGWREPREVAVKAVTQSPKQDSHEVSMKLQSSCSCIDNVFPTLNWAPKREGCYWSQERKEQRETGLVHGWVNGKSRNRFTSTPVLQKPLETEWYRHCRVAEVKSVFEGKDESSMAIIWLWRNIFSASLDVENSLKNPSRLIFSCLVNLAQKLRSGN